MEHTKEPWFYHKPFTHKFYKNRNARGTWLLDMKDYGRAMECVNALAGIEDVEGFMKEVNSKLHTISHLFEDVISSDKSGNELDELSKRGYDSCLEALALFPKEKE